MKRLVAVALSLSLAVAAVAPRVVHADATAEASSLKKKGDLAMDKLDYAGAIAAYAEAYALAKDPAVLYNKGRAHQALAQFPEALRELELFDATAPPALKAKVPKLGALIDEIRAKVSTLTIRCNVKSARVLVRDRVASIDGAMQLQSGTAVIEATADGYLPHREELTLPGGGALTVDIVLKPRSTTGVLTVKSPVAGATALVDGKPIGTTPAQVVLPAGSHRVVVRSEGYDEAEVSAVVTAGATREVTVDLAKHPGLASKWWFWTGISVVVIGGSVLTYSLLTERKPDSGDFSPGRVSGPLITF